MKGCKSAIRNDLIAFCASNLWSCPTVTKWDNIFEKASSVFYKFEQIEQRFRWLFFVALSQAADFLLMVFADWIKKKNQIIGNNSNQELIYNPPEKLTFQFKDRVSRFLTDRATPLSASKTTSVDMWTILFIIY